MLQCEMWVRDNKLRTLYSLDQWKSRLSCSILAAGIEGQEVTTLEGLKEEAEEFGAFLAQEGAEQCGFCSPGFIMNVLAMVRELENPTIEEMKEYLSGNLCRCTGYMGQLRAIRKYMAVKSRVRKRRRCRHGEQSGKSGHSESGL